MNTIAGIIRPPRPQPINMIGYTWGHWRVVAEGPCRRGRSSSRAQWIVRCDCGAERTEPGTSIRSERARAYIKCARCDP